MALILNRIKELREQAELSQRRLAKRIGVSEMTVRRWECGERSPSAEALLQISSVFDTNVGYILGQTDDPSPPSKFQVRVQFLENDEESEDFFRTGLVLPENYEDENEIANDTTRPIDKKQHISIVGETSRNVGAISGGNIGSISGSGNIGSILGSGNAIVGSGKGKIITKTEHVQTISDCDDAETTTEKSDNGAPSEKCTIFEYKEYREGASDKEMKFTFPPGTSPEEMEAIIARSARAVFGSDPREKPPVES